MTQPMIPTTCDVAIVGAGPAGATLAGLLAKRGVDVVLLERDAFPRDKLCGEFLSFEARPILEELGVADAVERRSVGISTSRIFAQGGAMVHTQLPAQALGVARLHLDETLFERAGALGARCLSRARVTSLTPTSEGADIVFEHAGATHTLRASVAVGAWGRRTSLDRHMGRPFTQVQHPWVGMKQHHVARDARSEAKLHAWLDDTVELHAFDGGYCGLNFVDEHTVNACALLTQDAFEALGGKTWAQLAQSMQRSCDSLRARMACMVPANQATQAVAQVPFERKELSHDGVFWLGDAAGMITPMTGDGQAMAIESASLLAPVIDGLLADLAHQSRARAVRCAEDAWKRQWHKHFSVRHRLGRVLQSILIRPALADGVIRFGAHVPALPNLLARATRGDAGGSRPGERP